MIDLTLPTLTIIILISIAVGAIITHILHLTKG
jgi:hypothetical protein